MTTDEYQYKAAQVFAEGIMITLKDKCSAIILSLK